MILTYQRRAMSMFAKKRSEAGRARQRENQESSLWEKDKELVFHSCATFNVKVLGEVAVEEARGIETCEFAVKDMPYKKNKTKGLFKIYSNGLTFVEEKTNSLAINQPIEKVSFCCALPSNERIFTYISRDGFAKQWVCHAFVTTKGVTADRVSHACACAFTACLQKKQEEHKKHGLAPISGNLDMRRVRSSGDVLEKSSKSRSPPTRQPDLRPLGGSRGDLLDQSMEMRETAARQTSIRLMLESSSEMNGDRNSQICIPRPRNSVPSGSSSIQKDKRLSLPDSNPFEAPPSYLVDPWAPSNSPIKKNLMDPFDPFSPPLLQPPVAKNPFSSMPLNTTEPPPPPTNPFL